MLLRHEPATFIHALRKSLRICMTVYWVLPLYLLYTWLMSTPFFLIGIILFFYIEQLLFDKEYSFKNCFLLSWKYFKESFWALFRVGILSVMIFLVFLSCALFCIIVAYVHYISILGASFILAVLSIFTTIFIVILKIAINKLYLEVKSPD